LRYCKSIADIDAKHYPERYFTCTRLTRSWEEEKSRLSLLNVRMSPFICFSFNWLTRLFSSV
jgi:hypothetical protein